MHTKLEISVEEFYQLLGERLVIQYKLEQQIREFYAQADQMAEEITKLRTELKFYKEAKVDGKLE